MFEPIVVISENKILDGRCCLFVLYILRGEDKLKLAIGDLNGSISVEIHKLLLSIDIQIVISL